ncbi:MAG: sulfatase [Rudaea sp.]|uniref:sulfatase family protein n=1 Tax=Rudaea sp. TaxID=2136325 RepID=UPI0039E4777B
MNTSSGFSASRRKALRSLAAGVIAGGGLSAGCAPAVHGSRAADKRRPNIVFIMTDDHSRTAMSLYGNRILQTPNLDRIAHEGLRFDEAFVTCSLCLPSRASYLTSQYPHTHGLRTNGEEAGFTAEPRLRNAATWPNLLRAQGYHTGVVGKWHINTLPENYDYIAVLKGQSVYFDPPMYIDGEWHDQKGHTDDLIGDHALRFLKNRPRDKPFALCYQFKAPHREWQPAPRFARRFDDVEVPLPVSFFESLQHRSHAVQQTMMRIREMPDFRKLQPGGKLDEDTAARLNWQNFIKNYYRVLLGVDENVGRVLDWLDRAGLAENTLVVYTTDNGFFLGEHGLFDKRLMYEPAIRVPLLVRWPQGIRPGSVDGTHMTLNIDVAPTMLSLAGVSVPATMQGANWLPLFAGDVRTWRTDFLYEYYEFPGVHCVRPHRGVRDARFKLIEFWRDPAEYELYDLKNDPDEERNLVDDPAFAAEKARLKTRMAALREQYADHDPPDYLPPQQIPQACHY